MSLNRILAALLAAALAAPLGAAPRKPDPNSLEEVVKARLAERMLVWGAMLGFLLLLYAATEIIQTWKMAGLAGDMQRAIAGSASHLSRACRRSNSTPTSSS